MRYIRKKNNSIIVTKILNFNQKSLPDPNAKYTTMDQFLRIHEIKGKFIRLRNIAFKFIDNTIYKPKKTIINQPSIYSEKNGYMNTKKEVLPKNNNLVLPLIND